MANAGYILIKNASEGDKGQKGDFRKLYGPQDKGSAKPSFCYPKQKESLVEDIKGMEKALKDGYVGENRVMQVKHDLRLKKQRLDAINDQEADAMKLVKANKDAIDARRKEIAETIAQAMPTSKEVEKKRVNSQRIFENEKRKGLGNLKREYQVLSKALEEESNTSFLQRD